MALGTRVDPERNTRDGRRSYRKYVSRKLRRREGKKLIRYDGADLRDRNR